MQGIVEFRNELIKAGCGTLFWGLLAACVCQLIVTAHRWNTETERQEQWIQTNQMRWQTMCVDPNLVYNLKMQEECKTYNEIRNQKASVLAMVFLAKEWQWCDAENGGCRGFMGFLIGAFLAVIAVLYLLRQMPGYLNRFIEDREVYDTQQLMHVRAGGGRRY